MDSSRLKPATIAQRLSWRAHRARERLNFACFRTLSQARFGSTRWINTEAGRLVVRSDDFRAFMLARLPNGQGHILELWRALSRLGPDLCIDVGANYGEFATAIASLDTPVLAIEPNPLLTECMEMTFAQRPQIRVVQAAVSDREEMIDFYVNRWCSGFASVSERVAAESFVLWGESQQASPCRVKTQTLDAIVTSASGAQPRTVILKIDVEGAEPKVLRGALGLLASCEWWRGIVEWSPLALQRAGLTLEEAWRTYRLFAGLIIEKNARPEIGEFLDSLPETAPTEKCDILLGAGRAPLH
jgi:FkbM family methyltransferase